MASSEDEFLNEAEMYKYHMYWIIGGAIMIFVFIIF